MDLTVFLLGTASFGVGFVTLLVLLLKKKKLTISFVFMGIGVFLCFLGLLLAAPTEDDPEDYDFTLKEIQHT
ncbi:hypothetical protein B0H94_10373 [Salsuginibacillus halophilus]|uniref:Uncharacterized protein n=1 Tax=Salsuginibacillus halophilus TaxID=517424 RepID=A0A2P8HW47_9BACI|nr:hypothetical protein [Salsuginibacillus halophilus]PSL50462.1 hypothetical protein B0H94_10373 [Salsuginibacillus halophilus]